MSQSSLTFLLTTRGWGGLEMNVLRLANHFRDSGRNVYFICRTNSKMMNQVAEAGFDCIPIRAARKYFDFSGVFYAHRQIKKHKSSHLFYFDNSDSDRAAWIATFSPQLEIVFQQHMQMSLAKRDWLHTWRYSRISKWIAPLQSLKEQVIRFTHFPPERIHVIPLGINTEAFSSRLCEKNMARQKLSLPATGFIFGVIGRIDPLKGQHRAIEALQRLRSQGRDAELVIAGSPTIDDERCLKYDEQLKTLVALEQLNVHFLGHRADPALFYSAVDLVLMTSESETYGMVTLEAMLAGCPVIGTNSGGTPDLLGEGRYGLLFNRNSTDELVQCINRVMDQPDETKLRVEQAKARVESLFDEKQEFEAIDRLID